MRSKLLLKLVGTSSAAVVIGGTYLFIQTQTSAVDSIDAQSGVHPQTAGVATRLETLHTRAAARATQSEAADVEPLRPEQAIELARLVIGEGDVYAISQVIKSGRAAYEIRIGPVVVYIDLKTGRRLPN